MKGAWISLSKVNVWKICVSVNDSFLSPKDKGDSWALGHVGEVSWLMILVVFWMLEGDVKELSQVGNVKPDEGGSHATS